MSDSERRDLTQYEEMARRAGVEGAREVLRLLGIDIDDPIEAQQDFAMLRRLRRIRDRSVMTFWAVILTLIITGLASMWWSSVHPPASAHDRGEPR